MGKGKKQVDFSPTNQWQSVFLVLHCTGLSICSVLITTKIINQQWFVKSWFKENTYPN